MSSGVGVRRALGCALVLVLELCALVLVRDRGTRHFACRLARTPRAQTRHLPPRLPALQGAHWEAEQPAEDDDAAAEPEGALVRLGDLVKPACKHDRSGGGRIGYVRTSKCRGTERLCLVILIISFTCDRRAADHRDALHEDQEPECAGQLLDAE